MSLFSFCASLSGALFGTGLVVSGMTDPQRVIGFLDVFGHFDPRLAFVLGGALLVTLGTFEAVLRMRKPLAAPPFELPEAKALDRPLIAGAAIFGVGWGSRAIARDPGSPRSAPAAPRHSCSWGPCCWAPPYTTGSDRARRAHAAPRTAVKAEHFTEGIPCRRRKTPTV